jgi:hypothetical protein
MQVIYVLSGGYLSVQFNVSRGGVLFMALSIFPFVICNFPYINCDKIDIENTC